MRYFGAREGKLIAGGHSFNRLLGGNYIHNSALISTRFLKEIGGYNPAMKGGYEDWELYISLAESGAKFAYVPKAILNYRQHNIQSRNINAELTAKTLHDLVKSLHPQTYKNYKPHSVGFMRIVKGLKKHPLLPVHLLYKTPRIIMSTVKASLKYLKWRTQVEANIYVGNRKKPTSGEQLID
jgi:GT2 family glycosyltransferase